MKTKTYICEHFKAVRNSKHFKKLTLLKNFKPANILDLLRNKKNCRLAILIFAASLVLCTVSAFAAPAIIEKMQPVLSEELKAVSIEMEKDVYDYTGEEIRPEISQITFKNKQNEKITKKSGEFKIETYIDNIRAGKADVEISLKGYQGTMILQDVFKIQPAQADGLQINSVTLEAVELSWNETIGADGYALFKSTDGGQNYRLIAEITATAYQDRDVQPNAVYEYYVCADMTSDKQVLFGNPSNTVKQYTPLEAPMISAVKNASYNTLCVEWPAVTGAAGYQIYRSDAADGAYTLISEITDGAATSYSDAACECGKVYYYYMQACQATDTERIFGTASEIVSGRTTPNSAALSGTTSDGNTKVVLEWKKISGAQGYEVYKDNHLISTIENADTLTWSEAGLAKDAEHRYKIRAYCIADNEKLYGSYSRTYEKDVTIEYNYGEISAELAALTQYAGYRYVYGGTSPTTGWDCSGFVQYVFLKHFGISIGRTSGEQASRGTSVSKNARSEWKPGDLLFYTINGRINHVAIYLGNGQMIHALNSKYNTLIQDVDYYERWDSKTTLYCVKRYM